MISLLQTFFSVCSGRSQAFFYNFSDFYQIKTYGSSIWSLSITNLFYLLTIISFFSSMIVTPFCYAAIHRLQSNSTSKILIFSLYL